MIKKLLTADLVANIHVDKNDPHIAHVTIRFGKKILKKFDVCSELFYHRCAMCGTPVSYFVLDTLDTFEAACSTCGIAVLGYNLNNVPKFTVKLHNELAFRLYVMTL